MDVNLTVGGSNTFDVPPGRSEKAYEFTLPVGGRLLGVGGHLHDYGSLVKLVDAESGKELTRVTAKRDSSGKVLGVSRKLFGVSGEGLKLKPNHRYKVVGVYDNPTGEIRPKAAMAHMVGLFVPDDMSKWPRWTRRIRRCAGTSRHSRCRATTTHSHRRAGEATNTTAAMADTRRRPRRATTPGTPRDGDHSSHEAKPPATSYECRV